MPEAPTDANLLKQIEAKDLTKDTSIQDQLDHVANSTREIHARFNHLSRAFKRNLDMYQGPARPELIKYEEEWRNLEAVRLFLRREGLGA